MISMGFEIDKTDLARVRHKLSDRRTKVGRTLRVGADPIEHFVQYIGLRWETRARDKAPFDRGGLRSGIRFRFTGTGGEVVSLAKHSIFVHEDTRPHWPPPGALAGWAKRHGIPEFLVARKIAQEGTEGTPFLTEAFDETLARDVAPTLRETARRIEHEWGRR